MAAMPRKIIGKQGRWESLQIPQISDGEQRNWPKCPPYRPSNDENYCIQLGQIWEAHPQPGISYYIERLPENYALFEVQQPSGPQIYKRLFGHPTGKFYDSINKFKPHFLWLMSGMQGDCTCHHCSQSHRIAVPRQKRQPRDTIDPSLLTRPKRDGSTAARDGSGYSSEGGIAAGRARRDVKQSGAPDFVDEEGTDDVFKRFIKRLEAAKDSKRGIDQDLHELNSIDWQSEHYDEGSNLMQQRLAQIDHQPSFLPRTGELVLWITDFPDGVCLLRDTRTSEYKFYSHKEGRFHGSPAWRAGVVTSTPSIDLQMDPDSFQDLLGSPEKKTALNMAGYRVETFPDPNDTLNKSTSKQYKWISLRSIRPLSQWKMLLHGIAKNKLHPSISHGLRCATSISLLEKFKATGFWPGATLHCKGIYLGPELITVGDTVRLCSPDSLEICEDVLKIQSIRLNLENIKAEYITRDSPLLAPTSWISFVGKAYTSNPRRRYGGRQRGAPGNGSELNGSADTLSLPEVKTVFRAIGTSDYGPWYHLHDPRKNYLVSHEQVLGRVYEKSAVQLWNLEKNAAKRRPQHSTRKVSLNYDIWGVLAARRFATLTDARLPTPVGSETLWFWADTRAEALAVESFNGLEVGKHWQTRDKETLDSWQTQMRVINGLPTTTTEVSTFVPPSSSTRGRKAGTIVRNGKVIYPGDPEYEIAVNSSVKPKASSQMAGAALASTDEGESDEDNEAGDIDKWTAQPTKWRATGEFDGVEVYQPELYESRNVSKERSVKSPDPQPNPGSKAPLTKTQIMADAVRQSVEGGYLDDDISQDSWHDAVPLARGGTEESSGGDYEPQKDVSRRRRNSDDSA